MSRGLLKAQSIDAMQVAVKKASQSLADCSSIAALPALICSEQHKLIEATWPKSRASSLQQALWPPIEDLKEELMIGEESEKVAGKRREEEGGKIFFLWWQELFRLKKVKVKNPSLRRLLSGAFAGAVSRTAVAPLETIRTHLMVGNAGNSVGAVFVHIMQHEGWQGLFRGNGINVIRVTPSKAIELFAYDTVKKVLQPKEGEAPRISFPLPVPTIAGAAAGVCSTVLTYPLELLKTRLTVQRGVYDNLLHAFLKIVQDEGPLELYRGLVPSVIGIIPYCGINYLAYESLKKGYRRLAKEDRVGHLATLLIGSAAGVISSSATYPLEVARKQMQVGALNGRQVYRHLFHALSGIVEKQGVAGLYRGIGASCIKLVPAAGISFMCYEACKQILLDEEEATSKNG
ncbi:adenine nucleotide transporter BT1, chloroplastic/mitochondrial [Selaginella moellendorffii]|nr:adenine nucleotide transporter BT1, chloroplastic/mitochondrial [Selaginella moellendorffii]|eukprot:XP_002973709.2 adenine nucleotide transporter BT1, chloroplastic/mitochondrial [Selaginella moellendorffii]